jgi:hypothetical protein
MPIEVKQSSGVDGALSQCFVSWTVQYLAVNDIVGCG